MASGRRSTNCFIRATILILLGCSLPPIPASAQESDDVTRIDRWMDKAIYASGTKEGYHNALAEAQSRWDRELNRRYQRVLAILKPDEKPSLVRSEKAWIALRDAEADVLVMLDQLPQPIIHAEAAWSL